MQKIMIIICRFKSESTLVFSCNLLLLWIYKNNFTFSFLLSQESFIIKKNIFC